MTSMLSVRFAPKAGLRTGPDRIQIGQSAVHNWEHQLMAL